MSRPWTTGPARARSRAAATVQTRTSASIQTSVDAVAPSARFASSTPANAGRTPAGKKVATATIIARDRSRTTAFASRFASMRSSRSLSVPSGSSSADEPSAPSSPSAVGATSTIETRPGIRVESDVRTPL
jgi:hypothetical protein